MRAIPGVYGRRKVQDWKVSCWNGHNKYTKVLSETVCWSSSKIKHGANLEFLQEIREQWICNIEFPCHSRNLNPLKNITSTVFPLLSSAISSSSEKGPVYPKESITCLTTSHLDCVSLYVANEHSVLSLDKNRTLGLWAKRLTNAYQTLLELVYLSALRIIKCVAVASNI